MTLYTGFMPSEPLTLLIFLFFLALVLGVLFIWFLLTIANPGRARPQLRKPDQDEPKLEQASLPERSALSNDAYRGARRKKLTPQERQARSDAFETFARSSKDDLNF